MNLRILGQHRLKTLPGQTTRPTMGRVREALFNILQGQVAGKRWLDLCCGCGSIGAEALLREAAWVAGIEQDPEACRVTNQNWEASGKGRFKVYPGTLPNVLGYLMTQETPFDLVYFDPPYTSGLYQPVMERLLQSQLVAATGQVICEHTRRHAPGILPGWQLLDQRRYGTSNLSFYGLDDAAPHKPVDPN